MSTAAWVPERADVLLTALESYGISMTPVAAADLITERSRSVAQFMRTTEAAARHYLTDDAIAGMAESIAFSLADEAPGADLYAAPRTFR